MLWKFEEQCDKWRKRSDYVNPAELIRLQAELDELKQQSGEPPKRSILFRAIDSIFARSGNHVVSRSRYIRLALTCGWFTGAHRFYAGQKLTGTLYLLFCWTGVPFAMTVMDLLMAVPAAADETGMIRL